MEDKKKPLRKRIRDLEKSMKFTEDPVVKASKEERLDYLRKLQFLTIKNPAKWNKDKNVRFFERKKVERRLVQVMKQEPSAEREEKRKELLEDLEYVKNYPVNKKYMSMYADDSDKTKEYREVMRKLIKGIIRKKAKRKHEIVEIFDNQIEVEEDEFFTTEAVDEPAYTEEVRLEAPVLPQRRQRPEPMQEASFSQKREKRETVERVHKKFD
mmetsp:Transcript_32607/g.56614  ORF Transcript_32607/g.56614 Transcript_32607/m.56614 type:complete len:212 (+) Transcript_32607:2893-3528(+)